MRCAALRAQRGYRNVFSHVPSTKVREIAAMLKAIHAGEDIAAARQKADQVIEKLRGLRLIKAAEIVETAVDETLAYYAFPDMTRIRSRTLAPRISYRLITRWNASCARSDGAPVLSARSRTASRRSTLPRPGCATSPAPLGQPNDTSTCGRSISCRITKPEPSPDQM